jgi:GNAT superfamily N-acetyltransferase
MLIAKRTFAAVSFGLVIVRAFHGANKIRATSEHGRRLHTMSRDAAAVDLELVDHRRGAADKYSWLPPFDRAAAYENEQWWDDVRYYYVDEPWFVQVLEDGAEVARVELDDPGGINPTYANVPVIGPERLEVQLIEVATAARGRGVGTLVVQALADRHPSRRLFAYSEEAHRFWASLRWDRFDHPEGPQFHRPLFIQRATSL